MLYYDEIDLSEENDVAKSNNSKECIVCHYWLFNHGSKFQDPACNGCHDLTIMFPNFSDIAIATAKNVDFRCVIHNISKSDAIHLLKNSVLDDRRYI